MIGVPLLISSRTPAPVLQRNVVDGPCVEGYVARIKENEKIKHTQNFIIIFCRKQTRGEAADRSSLVSFSDNMTFFIYIGIVDFGTQNEWFISADSTLRRPKRNVR